MMSEEKKSVLRGMNRKPGNFEPAQPILSLLQKRRI